MARFQVTCLLFGFCLSIMVLSYGRVYWSCKTRPPSTAWMAFQIWTWSLYMDHRNDICLFSSQCNYLNIWSCHKSFFLLPQQLNLSNSQVEKLMEKLEESETKRRLSIKTGIVVVSLAVSCMIFCQQISTIIWILDYLLSILHFLMVWSYSFPIEGWLYMVWMYLQAGQGYIQQLSPLHIMDPHNVRIKEFFFSQELLVGGL